MEADLGVVPTGSTRAHVFEIRNDGDRVWRIGEIRTSCSCTVASADRAVVRPGQVVQINLQFRAYDEAADFRKASYISFEPSVGPTIVYALYLFGKVRSQLSLSSRLIDFAILDHTAADPKAIVALNYSDHDFRGLRCDPSVSWLKAIVSPQPVTPDGEKARQAWKIQLQPSTDLKSGYYRTDVRIVELDPPRGGSPQVKLATVALCVRPRIAVMPTSLFFGLSRALVLVHKDVELKLPREPSRDHEVSLKVSGPIKSIASVALLSREPGVRRYRITCTRDSQSSPSQLYSGAIQLSLTDGQCESVTLPVFALNRD
jgi:Protein of unknown function (DUF1573)